MNNPTLKQEIYKGHMLFLSILNNHLNISQTTPEKPTPFNKALLLNIDISVEPPFVVAKATHGIVGILSDHCSAGDITLLRFLLNRMKRTGFFLNLFTLLGIV